MESLRDQKNSVLSWLKLDLHRYQVPPSQPSPSLTMIVRITLTDYTRGYNYSFGALGGEVVFTNANISISEDGFDEVCVGLSNEDGNSLLLANDLVISFVVENGANTSMPQSFCFN